MKIDYCFYKPEALDVKIGLEANDSTIDVQGIPLIEKMAEESEEFRNELKNLILQVAEASASNWREVAEYRGEEVLRRELERRGEREFT